jgi:hypothetical protein
VPAQVLPEAISAGEGPRADHCSPVHQRVQIDAVRVGSCKTLPRVAVARLDPVVRLIASDFAGEPRHAGKAAGASIRHR